MNVPKLRFKADDGSEFPEWEEKKLGNLFPYIRNGFVGVVTDYFCSRDEGVEYIEGTNIHDGYIDDVIDLYVTHEFDERHINSRLKKDDIVMVQSGHVGECAVVGSHHENANCHALIVMSNGGHVVSEFYVAYFYSGSGKNVISFIQTGNTVKHILASEMKKIIVPYPSLPEQQKIASFLSTIDEIIQSTESELTAWQERKKGVMQKIFNREVRFKADDGSEFPEWEEKRLGEVTSRVTRRNNNMISDIPLTISGVYGLIDQRKYFNKIVAASDLSNYYLLKNGEFAYNRSSSVGYDFGAIKRLDSCEYGAVSTLYVCFSILDENDVCSDYLRVYFDSNIWNKYAASVCAEGARNHGLLNISVNDFFDMPVYIPSLPEQKRIAECLSALDEVITLTKKELSAWKEFKKGLLQQMFV